MAFENQLVEVTIPAAADLSGLQYRGVFINTSGSAGSFAEPGGTCGTPAFGVLTNKPSGASRGARVAIFGEAKLEAMMAVAIGDVIGIKNGGRGSVLTTGGIATGGTAGWAIGRAISAAGASGDIFTVFVNPFWNTAVWD